MKIMYAGAHPPETVNKLTLFAGIYGCFPFWILIHVSEIKLVVLTIDDTTAPFHTFCIEHSPFCEYSKIVLGENQIELFQGI